ncbi:MAG: GBS Bsp-like repeat-containing protein [Chordicoccus sp.]
MKRKMFQKVMAAVLCAGLAVPTAVQPLTVTAFADGTVAESAAEANAGEETTESQTATDSSALAEQDDKAVSDTDQEEEISDTEQAETVSDDAASAVVGDADSTTSNSATELNRGNLSVFKLIVGWYGDTYRVTLSDASIPNLKYIYFAVWSARDGQDDIQWYLQRDADDETEEEIKYFGYNADFTIPDDFTSKSGLYDGTYNVHCYALLKDGTMEFINSTTFNVTGYDTREMERYYNPNSGEHFYTCNEDEESVLIDAGWNWEGTAWTAPTQGAPIYRLYNPNAGDHHYTGSTKERDHLVSVGWRYEGIAWHTPSSGVPVYRLYNPNCTGAGAHHYTTNEKEKNDLVALGWRYEGIAWYGVKN